MRYTQELYQAKETVVGKCDVCGGEGYVNCDDPDKIKYCECMKLWKQMVKYAHSNIPPMYWRVLEDKKRIVSPKIVSSCKTIKVMKRKGMGFIILGDAGKGKTRSGCYILASALGDNYSAMYVLALDLRFDDYYKQAMEVDFLVVDTINDFQDRRDDGLLGSVAAARVGHWLPMILISDYSFSEFKEKFSKLLGVVSNRMEVIMV